MGLMDNRNQSLAKRRSEVQLCILVTHPPIEHPLSWRQRGLPFLFQIVSKPNRCLGVFDEACQELVFGEVS